MNLSPAAKQQFLDDDGTPLVGGKLWTYVSGTTTNQTTYVDKNGGTTNTNPIVLDARGECDIRLDPTLEYTYKLLRSDDTEVWTADNITAAALANAVVSSVNGLTGVVTFTAADIPFTTGTATTWFVGTDVAEALDSIITKIDTGVTAGGIAIVDAGGYFTGTSVEAALQELGAAGDHGKFLRETIFTSSGTWTKGSDVGSIVVEAIGAGGGVTNDAGGRGGGGAGGYLRKFVSAPSASYGVVIGTSSVGADGGDTTVAGCTAGGGKLGPTVVGGLGGTASGGDINLNGGGGNYGGAWSANVYYGAGGSSYFGGGAVGNINNATGSVGQPSTGGGASGGSTTGAAGGSGLVIITEYT